MFKCLTRQDSKPVKVVRRKLVVVGDGECGKTCLLHRFVRKEFTENGYLPTVFEVDVAEVLFRKTRVDLSLYDTAGQECYDRLRPMSYVNTDVVLIVFSIDNPDSFINVVKNWSPEVRHFCGKIPVLLVGTKSDLRYMDNDENNNPTFIKEGPVKYEAGMAIAKQIGALSYLECSSKTNFGVETVFNEAVKCCFRKMPRTKNVVYHRDF